jgi:lysozyme
VKVNAKLIALVGAGCCSLLITFVPKFEGEVRHGYRDPIGIITACDGHTATAELGRTYTHEECESLLQTDLLEHAEGVEQCVNIGELTTGQRAAVISFAFNVGVQKFCDSTFARKLNHHDSTACAELSKWIYAGGRQLPGLVSRRATERAICEGKVQ